MVILRRVYRNAAARLDRSGRAMLSFTIEKIGKVFFDRRARKEHFCF